MCLIQHQALQVIVLTMKQRQRHDLIDRHDLRVAQGDGEKRAEVVECGLKFLTCRAAIIHDDRIAVHRAQVVVGPLTIGHRSVRPARADAGELAGLGGKHLHLHAAFRGLELAGDDKLSAIRQGCRQAKLQHRRCLHANAGLIQRTFDRLQCRSQQRTIEGQQLRVQRTVRRIHGDRGKSIPEQLLHL